jgi:hypothetical protein
VLTPPEPALQDAAEQALDLKDIKGQETAKRALEVSRLLSRASPACHLRLRLSAKPSLAFGNVDYCWVVVFPTGHVIDALARVNADVAFYGAGTRQ